jgi:hypothetical protein
MGAAKMGGGKGAGASGAGDDEPHELEATAANMSAAAALK